MNDLLYINDNNNDDDPEDFADWTSLFTGYSLLNIRIFTGIDLPGCSL